MTTATASSIRFTLDVFNKTISGTKASFDKASKGEGPIYEELARKMAAHPDYRLVIKEQKIQKEKKETYEGLNFTLMEAYIAIQDNANELMEAYKEVKKFAKEAKLSSYPITKKWFLEQFEGFNVIVRELAVDRNFLNGKAQLQSTEIVIFIALITDVFAGF